MKKYVILWDIVFFNVITSPRLWAKPVLIDWTFYDNDSIYTGDENGTSDFLGQRESRGYNWDKGLGLIMIAYTESSSYSFVSFFDHEIVGVASTFMNNSGESMAKGREFFLLDNETGLFALRLTEQVPTLFYLQQNDPESPFYRSSSLVIESSTTPFPESVSIVLLGTGLCCQTDRCCRMSSR
jgi:hypothetical protein